MKSLGFQQSSTSEMIKKFLNFYFLQDYFYIVGNFLKIYLEHKKKKFKGKLFPNAENLAKKGLSLPINPELKLRDIKKITEILNSF